MMKRAVLLLLACLGLSAQEDPFDFDLPQPTTLTRVAVGGYDQAFSDGYGRWKGWTLEGTIYPARGGPWQLAAVGFDRPEGKGTLFSVGKYLLIGKASSIYLGASGGTNTDILPRGRVDVDLHLDVAHGWKVDLAGAISRFHGDQEVRLLQAGPGYQGRSWSASAWYQRLQYEPYGDSDDGCILNFRFGGNDLAMWHSLRLAWGRGIIESTASGGGLASTTTAMTTGGSGYGGRFGYGGTGSSMMGGTTGVATFLPGTRPQERLASLSGHWPLNPSLALKAEATWGERASTYHFWGGSLQVVVSF
ncbi:MAG TPA: YaiO family outer membrane beta-barrel protein [Geothrix sp.]|nr:YaiO family outer membrane beta-barrel protein [Geothrix sp.]